MKNVYFLVGLIIVTGRAFSAEAEVAGPAVDLADLSNELAAFSIDASTPPERMDRFIALLQQVTEDPVKLGCIINTLDFSVSDFYGFLENLTKNCVSETFSKTARFFNKSTVWKSAIDTKNASDETLMTLATVRGCAPIIHSLITNGFDINLVLLGDQIHHFGPPVYLRLGMNCNPQYEEAFRILYPFMRHGGSTEEMEEEIAKAKIAYPRDQYCSGDFLNLDTVFRVTQPYRDAARRI